MPCRHRCQPWHTSCEPVTCLFCTPYSTSQILFVSRWSLLHGSHSPHLSNIAQLAYSLSYKASASLQSFTTGKLHDNLTKCAFYADLISTFLPITCSCRNATQIYSQNTFGSSLCLVLWKIFAPLLIYLHLTQIGRNTIRHANSQLMPSSSNTTIANSRMLSEERSRSGLTTESDDQRREVTISQILVIIVIVFLVTQSFKVRSRIIDVKWRKCQNIRCLN